MGHIAREAERRKHRKRLLQGDKLHKVRRTESGKVYLGTKPLTLGRRVPAKEDTRDYPYEKRRGAVKLMTTLNSKMWPDNTWQGDQGAYPHCVAYSSLHRIENSPRTYPATGPVMDPKAYYDRAQQLDEWAGTSYDGTSCRAGAKVAKEAGYISEYRRAESMTDFLAGLISEGPWVVGTFWYSSMFEPRWIRDATGTYRWTLVIDPADGGIAGGHAWLVNGINYSAKVVRMLQSWGETWGNDGRAWVSFDTIERLIFGEQGEAFMFKEIAA